MTARFYPLARVALLPEASTQTLITPRLVILHTNASPGPVSPGQLWTYMARPDVNLECHFDVATDGEVWQYMPIDRRADCNAQANPFAVSIETEDAGASMVNMTLWTPPQCDAIVKLLAWLADVAGIPMHRAFAWDASGVGAHRDYPEWSAAAHSCPGDARTSQVPILIARAAYPVGAPTVLAPVPMSERWVRRPGTNDVYEICHAAGRTWAFHVGGPDDPGAENEALDGLFYDQATMRELPGALLDKLCAKGPPPVIVVAPGGTGFVVTSTVRPAV